MITLISFLMIWFQELIELLLFMIVFFYLSFEWLSLFMEMNELMMTSVVICFFLLIEFRFNADIVEMVIEIIRLPESWLMDSDEWLIVTRELHSMPSLIMNSTLSTLNDFLHPFIVIDFSIIHYLAISLSVSNE